MVAAVAADDEQGLSTDLRALVRARSEGWAHIWAGEGQEGASEEATFVLGEALPPALTVDELTAASEGFRMRTSTVDGLHPRHVRHLFVGSLGCLSLLLRAYEAQAAWAPSLAEVIVRLMPKDSGGHRIIGLFRALFRVWAKARAAFLMKWA